MANLFERIKSLVLTRGSQILGARAGFGVWIALLLFPTTAGFAGEWVPTGLQPKQAVYISGHGETGSETDRVDWLRPITVGRDSLDDDSHVRQVGLQVELPKPVGGAEAQDDGLVSETKEQSDPDETPDENDENTDAGKNDAASEVKDADSDADDSGASDPAEKSGKNADGSTQSVPLDEDEKKDLGPFFRNSQSSFTWIPRGSSKNGIGQVSFESGPTWALDFESADGIDLDGTFGGGIHFLSGPGRSDLPPRVYDFFMNTKVTLGDDDVGVQANFNLGIHSDFETGSEGWRYPGRILGYIGEPRSRFVFGIEYFDLENLKVLPAVGLVIGDKDNTELELYFPRLRLKQKSSEDDSQTLWNYLSLEYHGSEWAIQRTSGRGDTATLTEYRLIWGSEAIAKDDGIASFGEIGWFFGRDLEYRSGLGSFQPHDAFMFRMGRRF
jgi:hypothetical protein